MNQNELIEKVKKMFPNWVYVESKNGLKFRNGPLPKGDEKIKFVGGEESISFFQSKRNFTIENGCLYYGVEYNEDDSIVYGLDKNGNLVKKFI